MAYTKTEWQARQGTGLNRFLKTQETADAVNLTNEPLTVTNPGTPFSEENMNHIEQGIEDAHEMIAAESRAREQSGNELAQAISDEAQARQEAGIEILEEAKAFTNETLLATQTWLPAASTKAGLPSYALNNKINYLCRVIADPSPENNGVYQAIAGWDGEPAWTFFSDNADWIDELELEEAIREHDENEGAHAGIQAAIAAEKQARQEADEGLQESVSASNAFLQENIQAETRERQNADQQLQNSIDDTDSGLKSLEDSFHAWIGRGGYLEAYDFGTPAPSQEDLTNQALSQIASIINPTQIWNGTKIENLHDGHLWALTNTQDTDPPILEWSDQGPARLSSFAQDSGGYIVGADPNTDGAGFVQAMPGGKGKVIGWEQIMAASSFLAAHPVGSIYLSVENVSPATFIGGTWTVWGSGRVPVGVDATQAEFNTEEKTGGAKTHELTLDEAPAHTHNAHAGSFGIGNESFSAMATGFTTGVFSLQGSVSRRGFTSSYNEIHPKGFNFNAAHNVIGGGNSHNNLQPYITCYMWKRTA